MKTTIAALTVTLGTIAIANRFGPLAWIGTWCVIFAAGHIIYHNK